MTVDVCKLVVSTLEDMKASDITVLDVSKITSITDNMIIASGRSSRHVKSLADKTIEAAKDNGVDVIGSEGYQQGEWILVDLGNVVAHVMQPTIREYYQLEKLWSQDAPKTKAAGN
ncbi:MAG: ribosome silencing factor [Gammaproteobacteria bacterium]|nr:ribosome silencing factor [Gammaproteobacteria bacterium]